MVTLDKLRDLRNIFGVSPDTQKEKRCCTAICGMQRLGGVKETTLERLISSVPTGLVRVSSNGLMSSNEVIGTHSLLNGLASVVSNVLN